MSLISIIFWKTQFENFIWYFLPAFVYLLLLMDIPWPQINPLVIFRCRLKIKLTKQICPSEDYCFVLKTE